MHWTLFSPLSNELRVHRYFYLVYLSAVAGLTIFFTWPVILHLSTSIYGYSGDSFGFIYYLWWWKDRVLNHLSLDFNPLVMAPFGTVIAPETGNIVFYWPAKVLTLLVNEVAAYNLNLLFSFVFSALTAYLLFFEISKNRLSAAVFSLIFAFSPYHFWKAYNHLDLAMIQYIPLYLWSLVRIVKNPNFKTGLTGGASLALLLLLNFYYGYFALLTAGLFFLYFLGESLLRKKLLPQLKYFIFTVFVGLVLSLPFVYEAVLPSSATATLLPESRRETYTRPLDNLLLLSARPWSYLFPSIDNPFLGKLSLSAYKFIETLSNDFKTQMPFPNEVTIYLGLFSFGFFVLSLWFCWKRKIERGLIPLLLFVIAGLFLVSMPPFIVFKSVTIYLPTFFLHKIFPMFRAYGRLGIFILPLVSGVAVLGFTYLFDRLKRKGKIILTASCFLFFLLEFTNIPPFRVTDFSKIPEAYAWLKDQPGDFSIMEYPKNFNLAEGELFQRAHGKKMASWYSTSPYYQIWTEVEDIYNSESYEILSALGVKYAVLHKVLLFPTPNPVDELWWARAYRNPIKYDQLPGNTSLVKSFFGEDVLEIKSDSGLYRLAVITNLTNGKNKIEIINNLWNPEKPGKLFIFNLTDGEVSAGLSDGKVENLLTLPKGKTIIKYEPGNYDLRIIAVSI